MERGEIANAVGAMLQALQAGMLERARTEAQAILQHSPGEPNANIVLARLNVDEGNPAEAILHLRVAQQAIPDHPHVLNMLGVAHRQLGNESEARTSLERAVALNSSFLDALLNLGQLGLDYGRLEDAKHQYASALAIDPENGVALTGLARAQLLSHNYEEARETAEKAIKQDPGRHLAKLTLAAAQLRLADFESALKTAGALAEEADLSADDRAYAAGLAADANDRLGRYDAAYEYYQRANDLQAEGFSNLQDADASPFSPKRISSLANHLKQGAQIKAPLCGEEELMPVFLVGFPRSGTTLLEQVLMSHPRVESFGEHAALGTTCAELFVANDKYAAFGAMDEAAAASFRATYWREVDALGELASGRIFMDKLPLNVVFLPAIAKIFPRAKIVFAMRDPRDVVVSCFQQRFGMNVAMSQLRSIDNAAAYYDHVMGLAMATRERTDLDLIEVKYESVVHDLEAEARRVVQFLGLDWDPAILAYRDLARVRMIETPSAMQVVEPIYSRAQGKWQNYENHLAPALSRLDPWIKQFGYA